MLVSKVILSFAHLNIFRSMHLKYMFGIRNTGVASLLPDHWIVLQNEMGFLELLCLPAGFVLTSHVLEQ